MSHEAIDRLIASRVDVYSDLRKTAFVDNLLKISGGIISCLQSGRVLLICGNGGSAAQAVHLAGELVGRYKRERSALPAVALNTDPAVVTAIANDYSYDEIFARQVQAFGRIGGALLTISTSGNSRNLLRAAAVARELGLANYALLGRDGGELGKLCDTALIVPAWDTPLIQEVHDTAIHLICDLVDDAA